MRMRLFSAGVLSASLGIAGVPALAQHEHHAAAAAPAHPSGPGAPLYNAEDLQFLHHMIVHHGQALDMAALAPERTEREDFIRFARYVARAQAAEITMMEGMLDMAAGRGLSVHAHDMSRDPPMAGMLSATEMAALEAASGPEFERLWLEGMIFHHEGALAMARAQQLQQLHYGRRPYGLEGLVETILVEQRAEIAAMRDWLVGWELRPADDDVDRRAPAAEISSPTPGATLTAGVPATVFGLAVDDRDIAAVWVGVQNLDTGAWARRDGTWGEPEPLDAELARSGPASAAWSRVWSPTTAGRYAVTVEAEDAAGRRVADPEPRVITAE